MFILEESQLIEDNTKDEGVLKLYKTLRRHETANDRSLLVDEILASKQCLMLTELLLDFHRENTSDSCKFTVEQRNEIFLKLQLESNDASSLALVIAATLVQLFVIENFTGPTNDEQNLPEVFQNFADQVDFTSLSRDGSEVYHKIVSPWLLKLAQIYWDFLSTSGMARRMLELEFLVWKHRYLTIYLMVLLEPAESICNDLRKIQEYIFDHHILNDTKENNTQLTRFNTVELCCELVQSALLRDSITFSRKISEYASEISGVSVEHTGVLGKRTKFQHKDIAQLVIKVTKSKEDAQDIDIHMPGDDCDLPKDVKLDDDTLLPDIAFVKEAEDGKPVDSDESLSVEAQLMMLTKLDHILKSEVMEESLKDEWTLAYLRSLTKNATVWAIKYKALALRSTIERKHMRKMDRALLQMEELIKASSAVGDTHKRLRSFYSVLPSSTWQLQRSLGDISIDLGLVKNALDVYLRIEYWEGIIKCYSALGQTVKAEKIIRQELAKKETPYLHCLFGDATDNIEHYERSWELSKCRFARAKKSIGTYYYVRKQYAEAIDNYELALSANPSNISILSLLAYSCLTLERYERAAECYRNITYHDDTSFLAWNNLSKAYIKLNQKERAWRTLREAIKCNYEEWKIWENFMLVSIEIGALDDVITAWHRIIDIKSSHKDDQILSALTYALVKRPSSKADDEYTKLLNDALKLVARLNSTSDCSSRLWICYFKLLIKGFEISKLKSEQPEGKVLSKLDIDSRVSKITNSLQRATPSIATIEAEFQVPDKIVNVLDSYEELVECYIVATEIIGQRPEVLRQWKYFKLSFNNLTKLLEKKGYKLDV